MILFLYTLFLLIFYIIKKINNFISWKKYLRCDISNNNLINSYSWSLFRIRKFTNLFSYGEILKIKLFLFLKDKKMKYLLIDEILTFVDSDFLNFFFQQLTHHKIFLTFNLYLKNFIIFQPWIKKFKNKKIIILNEKK